MTVSGAGAVVISALRARASFGRLLDEIEVGQRSMVIEKRGAPRAVLMSLRDYVKLAAPEPEVLRLIGEEAVLKETGKLSAREIDGAIRKARAAKTRATGKRRA